MENLEHSEDSQNSNEVSTSEQTTNESSAKVESSAGTQTSTDVLGAKMKEAFSVNTGKLPEATPDKGATKAANPNQGNPDAPTFTPVKYPAYGKEHEIKSEQELKQKLSQAHMNQRHIDEAVQSAIKEKTKVYNEFESEINKDPEFKVGIALLYNVPQLRKAFLELANEYKAKGNINPAEVELAAMKRAEAARAAEATEANTAQTRSMVEQHVAQIQDDLGGDIPEAYYKQLVAFVKGGAATDLVDAHNQLKALRGNTEEKAKSQTVSMQQKILKSQGVTGKGGVSTGTKALDVDALGEVMKKAMQLGR